MPLPPNASITDVIEKLTELEGINQKSELASVIGEPALNTDTIAQQIVKLQESKDLFATTLSDKGIPTVNTEPIDDMVVKVSELGGFKFATGVITAPTGAVSFQYYSNTTNVTQFRAVASGLNFKPTHIILTPNTLSSSAFVTEYYLSLAQYSEYIKQSVGSAASDTNVTNRGFKAQSQSAYVNETGFSLPVPVVGEYTYYAYG